MKKTLAILMVVALAATAVFADVTIGAWGRGFAVPIASNGDDMKAGQTISWGWQTGGGPIRTGFTVAGSADNVGFQVDMNADEFKAGIGDEAKIWVKPIDMLTLSVGKVQDNTLRGDMCFGMFNWLRTGAGGLGEDLTFTRLGNGTGGQVQGMTVAFAPIDALYINAALPLEIAYGTEDAAASYKKAQIGLGYTIDGIGKVKAQYIGSGATVGTGDDEKTNPGAIEAAFDLSMIENLYVGIGGHIELGDKVFNKETLVSLGVSYGFGSGTVYALGRVSLPKTDLDMGIDAGVGVDFNVTDALTLVADVRFQTERKLGDTVDRAMNIAFLAGIQKGLGNGVVGIGFQGSTNSVRIASLEPAAGVTDAFLFAVPIRFEYWF